MALYRMYVDEVGNHDLTHADDPNQRFLSLTGVILESDYAWTILRPEMDCIKWEFFQRDPDEPVILHRKELINRRPPFHPLLDPETERRFNETLLAALERWEFHIATVVIDKKEHRDRYRVWRHHPYHYCLQVLLEQFVLFLRHQGDRGDVMVESRGGQEDRKLKDSYARLYHQGTDYVAPHLWQATLTSSQLKLKPKSANIPGLQLADLVAHPSRREILIEQRLVEDERYIFGDRICEILRRAKYLRDRKTGRIEGYGRKLLP